ncbi:SMI1/KNR4 family protein [bacterium]|nr:SMI1/KNR4 family protein [bacterium]
MNQQQISLIQDKLKRLKEKDQHYAVFGSKEHQYQMSAVLAKTELRAFEEKHGIALPSAYVDFLTKIGSGPAGPDYGLFTLDSILCEECADPKQTFNPEDTDDLQGCLFIGHLGCGNHNLLVVAGEHAGEVWHELSEGEELVFCHKDFLRWYEAWLDRGLEKLDPKTPKGLRDLAFVHFRAGELEQAIALFMQAQAKAKSVTGDELGLVRAYRAAKQYDQAIQLCHLIMAGDDRVSIAAELLVEIYIEMQDYKNAKATCHMALDKGMPPICFYNQLAEIHQVLGLVDEAMGWLRKSLSIAKRPFEIYDRMIELYKEKKDYQKAIEICREAIDAGMYEKRYLEQIENLI